MLSNYFGVIFLFKFVSPSKFLVSIKQTPFFSVECNRIISAGISSSFYTFIIFPTCKSYHLVYLLSWVSSSALTSLLFSKLSYSSFFKSSSKSLRALIQSTTNKGIYMTGLPSDILMEGIIYSNPIKRK